MVLLTVIISTNNTWLQYMLSKKDFKLVWHSEKGVQKIQRKK